MRSAGARVGSWRAWVRSAGAWIRCGGRERPDRAWMRSGSVLHFPGVRSPCSGHGESIHVRHRMRDGRLCFGGPDLTDLYVATGGNAEHPGKGGVVRIKTEVPGLRPCKSRFV